MCKYNVKTMVLLIAEEMQINLEHKDLSFIENVF